MDYKQTLELNEMLRHVDLPEYSGVYEQCIYRVPQDIRQVNPEAYTPKVVSIGPLHNPRKGGNFFEPMQSDNILVPMEELKLKYLKAFLSRTLVIIEEFNLKIAELRSNITRCYPWPSDCYHSDFFMMILIDACFIIEHFLRYLTYEDWKGVGDPILLQSWLSADITNDLILLENQLPFFLLEEIYNLAGMNIEFPSFFEITFGHFDDYNFQKINPEGVYPKHFTDLLRTFMLPPSFVQGTTGKSGIIEHLYSATQLSEAGLVFKVIPEDKSLLDLEYQKGVLTMPCFKVHDGTEIYLKNVLAFEECQYFGNRYIAQCLRIQDFLIDTEKYVNILIDKKIIVNEMGDANAVPTMVNNLRKNNIVTHLRKNNIAIFIHEYFNTPWKIASTIVAVLLFSVSNCGLQHVLRPQYCGIGGVRNRYGPQLR